MLRSNTIRNGSGICLTAATIGLLVRGADVDVVVSEDWSVSDLTALEQAGFLQKIDEPTNPDDPFEKTIISYFVRLTE